MELEIKNTFILTFSDEEFRLFLGGIGETSVQSRIDAGMNREQSKFFTELYNKLGHLSGK